jgi:hypothetical protein
VTTIAVKIAIIAGLAMPLNFGTAFAGGSDPSDTEALSSQSDAALGESDCQAIWSGAAAGEDRLSYDKAAAYVADFQAADPDNDGYFDKAEFMDACQKGLVHSASLATAIPKNSHVMLRKR